MVDDRSGRIRSRPGSSSYQSPPGGRLRTRGVRGSAVDVSTVMLDLVEFRWRGFLGSHQAFSKHLGEKDLSRAEVTSEHTCASEKLRTSRRSPSLGSAGALSLGTDQDGAGSMIGLRRCARSTVREAVAQAPLGPGPDPGSDFARSPSGLARHRAHECDPRRPLAAPPSPRPTPSANSGVAASASASTSVARRAGFRAPQLCEPAATVYWVRTSADDRSGDDLPRPADGHDRGSQVRRSTCRTVLDSRFRRPRWTRHRPLRRASPRQRVRGRGTQSRLATA